MIPVNLSVLYDEDAETLDNCCSASFASLFEMRIEDVPDLTVGLFKEKTETANKIYDRRVNLWLASMGFSIIAIPVMPEHSDKWCDYLIGQGVGYHLISGISNRDTFHMMVGENGTPVHDPHPDSTGLLPPTEENPWIFEFIIKRFD